MTKDQYLIRKGWERSYNGRWSKDGFITLLSMEDALWSELQELINKPKPKNSENGLFLTKEELFECLGELTIMPNKNKA